MFNFGKKKNADSSNTTCSPENSSANQAPTAPQKHSVCLRKAEEGLENNIVRLKKDLNIDLSNHKARVFVVVDKSGSMFTLFNNGSVQETLTRLLPLALRFDDNGELEMYLFNNSYKQLPPMTINNYENYVQKEILEKGNGPTGGTSYAPVIRKTIDDYNDKSLYPAFGIFITDGENCDARETDAAIKKSSKYKIFYQFIGIGNERFDYLQRLDDLPGRKVDNTAFVKVESFKSLNDDELYAKLLEQYPQWLRDMKIN